MTIQQIIQSAQQISIAVKTHGTGNISVVVHNKTGVVSTDRYIRVVDAMRAARTKAGALRIAKKRVTVTVNGMIDSLE